MQMWCVTSFKSNHSGLPWILIEIDIFPMRCVCDKCKWLSESSFNCYWSNWHDCQLRCGDQRCARFCGHTEFAIDGKVERGLSHLRLSITIIFPYFQREKNEQQINNQAKMNEHCTRELTFDWHQEAICIFVPLQAYGFITILGWWELRSWELPHYFRYWLTGNWSTATILKTNLLFKYRQLISSRA